MRLQRLPTGKNNGVESFWLICCAKICRYFCECVKLRVYINHMVLKIAIITRKQLFKDASSEIHKRETAEENFC